MAFAASEDFLVRAEFETEVWHTFLRLSVVVVQHFAPSCRYVAEDQ